MVNSILNSNPSYSDVARCLGDRVSRTVAHNTTIHTTYVNGSGETSPILALSLHGNEIIRWYADGRIFISNGDWESVTTKSRLNQFTSAGVHSVNWQWFYTNHENQRVAFESSHADDWTRINGRYARSWNRVA